MNRNIIYVDFIFKRKKITSKPLLFIYKIKINIKSFFNNITINKSKININSSKKSILYPFKKVL